MAVAIAPQSFLALRRSKPNNPCFHTPAKLSFFNTNHKRSCYLHVGGGEFDVIPVQSDDIVDQQGGGVFIRKEAEETEVDLVVGGFGSDTSGRLTFEGPAGFTTSASRAAGSESGDRETHLEMARLVDRTINASIVLAAGSFAIAKLLTVDHNYWHGWTVFEILRYAPQHNWSAYEAALETNPVLAKMAISGVVYSLGDWIAQCYEGKPLFEFDRSRMFRSGLVGFSLHGSLSHYYYHFCEALFPFDDWWVVPAKVAFDQTAWSAVWNSIYFILLGILRRDSPANIFSEWKATFWPMLTAGWKLWPFAHLITYGVIPVEQRLLWVDTVELVWVTILSTYSNEKSEARTSEVPVKTNPSPPPSKGSSEQGIKENEKLIQEEETEALS